MRLSYPRPCGRALACLFFTLLWLLLATAACTGLPPPAATATPAPGAAGLDDAYYPTLGNGGYDVDHYTIGLDVQPLPNVISGTTTVHAHTVQPLHSLNLDFAGLTIDRIQVNGRDAMYTRTGRELTITPATPLSPDTSFSVTVAYHGSPQPLASVMGGNPIGWFHAPNGAIHVISEPDGAATWFPANDHPLDKATYTFDITVPAPWMVAASGRLHETTERNGHTRYVWQMDRPMASYLAAIHIGEFVVDTQPGPDGVVVRNYFPAGALEANQDAYAALPEMLAFFSDLFGPYPFTAYGVVVVDAASRVCRGMLALETQTLSAHCPFAAAQAERVIVHELAHQWFGNSVSLESWQDVWLKEGLATYASWLWATRDQNRDAVTALAQNQRRRLRMAAPIGEPPSDALYGRATYTGGALLFHALRLRVGDDAFFAILRAYTTRFAHANAGVGDFIAIAKAESGEVLDDFFQAWLTAEDAASLPDG